MPADMISLAILKVREALGGDWATGEHWDHEAISEATKVVIAARQFCEHEGGPGSLDYSAREIFDAKHAMKSALGMYNNVAEHMEMRNRGEV